MVILRYTKPRTCAPADVAIYQKRIWGHLLDRTDIYNEVACADYEKQSEAIRARVGAVQDIYNRRFSSNGSSDVVSNADMRVGEIRLYCKLP